MRLILVPALLGIFFVCVPASSGQKSTPEQPDISRSGLDFLEVCSSVDSEGTRDAVRVQREATLNEWYRERLREQIPPLLRKWERKVGVDVAELRIRRMKTRWGSCNASARRIWLNLELAKKPASSLEYILVHEMIHIHERRHGERFREMMDVMMPGWHLCRRMRAQPRRRALASHWPHRSAARSTPASRHWRYAQDRRRNTFRPKSAGGLLLQIIGSSYG